VSGGWIARVDLIPACAANFCLAILFIVASSDISPSDRWVSVLHTIRRNQTLKVTISSSITTWYKGEPRGTFRAPMHASNVIAACAVHGMAARALGCGTFYGRAVFWIAFAQNIFHVGTTYHVPSRRYLMSRRNATWLILPVVICLSQRLSHACVSMN
jgi:hypothetical protein